MNTILIIISILLICIFIYYSYKCLTNTQERFYNDNYLNTLLSTYTDVETNRDDLLFKVNKTSSDYSKKVTKDISDNIIYLNPNILFLYTAIKLKGNNLTGTQTKEELVNGKFDDLLFEKIIEPIFEERINDNSINRNPVISINKSQECFSFDNLLSIKDIADKFTDEKIDLLKKKIYNQNHPLRILRTYW